jgi:DNA-binding NtrC family response regulator
MSSNPKVLIVDDEERFRTTMSKLLAVRGLEVSSMGDGKEALKELREKSYDVLILDIRMPGMGGIEVMTELRKVDPFIEVIIMTGYASVDTAKKITELGAYDYLLKPYNIEDLMERIEAAYDRKCARQKLIGEQKNSSL